jgi:hypothetical protein
MRIEQVRRPVLLALILAGGFCSVGLGGADGEPKPYPRTLGEVKAMTQALAPRKGAGASLRNEFISRLKQYRFLCGVPYEDLTWDAKCADLAEHASSICAKLNKMTHTPEKPPGMSDAEYELGKAGAGQSNLFTGLTVPGPCVDGWMDDSDPKNIDRVGHRRWCLNPSMLKSAFGAAGNYAAMYAFDKSNSAVPEWDFVAYPARGYMPVQFFGDRHAWSVSPNMAKFQAPVEAQIKVTIQPADAKLSPAGPALKLDYFHVDTGGFGSGPAIIFRPAGFALQEGAFLVEVTGLKPKTGEPAPLRYAVHFVNLQKVPDSPEGAAIYTRHFQRRMDAIQALPDKVDQLEELGDLLESDLFRQIEPGVRVSIQKSFAELLKEPPLKREHDSALRYRQLAAMEAKAGKSRNQLGQVALSYRELSLVFKDTRAGKKAAEEFERLKGQLQ